MTQRLDLLLRIERDEKLVFDNQDFLGCRISPGLEAFAMRLASVV